MTQSYLEEKEHVGIIHLLEENWGYPRLTKELLDTILTVQNDMDYSLERDEVENELTFLENINLYFLQTEE